MSTIQIINSKSFLRLLHLAILTMYLTAFSLYAENKKTNSAQRTFNVPRLELTQDQLIFIPMNSIENTSAHIFAVTNDFPKRLPYTSKRKILESTNNNRNKEWAIHLDDKTSLRLKRTEQLVSLSKTEFGLMFKPQSKPSKRWYAAIFTSHSANVKNIFLFRSVKSKSISLDIGYPLAPMAVLSTAEYSNLDVLLANYALDDSIALSQDLYWMLRESLHYSQRKKGMNTGALAMLIDKFEKLKNYSSTNKFQGNRQKWFLAFKEKVYAILEQKNLNKESMRELHRLLIIFKQESINYHLSVNRHSKEHSEVSNQTKRAVAVAGLQTNATSGVSAQPTASKLSGPTPSATELPSISPHPSPRPSVSPSPSPSPSISPRPSPRPSISPSPSISPRPSPRPSVSPSQSPSPSISPRPSPRPSISPSPSPSVTITEECPDYGLVITVNGEPNDVLRSLTLRWHSVYATNQFNVIILNDRDTTVFNTVTTLTTLETHTFPRGVYKILIAERKSLPNGPYVWMCEPEKVEITKVCAPFKKPSVSKKNQAGKANFVFENLKSSGTLWYEIVGISAGKQIPKLTEEDAKIFTNPERKACYVWQHSLDMDERYQGLFSGLVAKIPGRFTTDKKIDDLTNSKFNDSHLVCIFLCPSCNPATTLKGRPDSFIRGFVFNADRQSDSSGDAPISPQAGAKFFTLKPTFHFPGSSNRTSNYPTYSFSLREGTLGSLLVNESNLTEPIYKLNAALKPGKYTYWYRTDFVGQKNEWSKPVTFSLSLPKIDMVEPLGTISTALPEFSWFGRYVPDSKYEFQLIDVESKKLIAKEFTRNSSLTLKYRLQYGKKYAWSIRTIQDKQAGKWSTNTEFYVRPRYPEIIAPLKKTYVTKPVFSWTPIEKAGDKVTYELRVNSKERYQNQKIFSVVTKDTVYQLKKALTAGKTLLIWVRPIINGKAENWRPAVKVRVTEGEK